MSNRYSKIRTVRTSDMNVEYTEPSEDYMHVVDLFENGTFVQTIQLPGKSMHYAQDVSENWDTGLIKLLTE